MVAVAIYSMWTALTLFHSHTPNWLLFMLGGWVIAWHSSLQHEIVHGHPTRWRPFNHALALPPLSLWLPFDIYRTSHLRHHNDERLTDPIEDPESKYLTAQQWGQLGTVGKTIELCQASLPGRLVLGPLLLVLRFLKAEADAIIRGHSSHVRVWLMHALAVLMVTTWLSFVCEMSLLKYITFFVYPGTALLILRSYAEHRAARQVNHRTAIVENTPLALLFLNNNLHAVHHRYPATAWYSLPILYKQNRHGFINDNGGLVYSGYAEVVSRYLLRWHDAIVHPQFGDESAPTYIWIWKHILTRCLP